MRWKLNPEVFLHGRELPARLGGESNRNGKAIPYDARSRPALVGSSLPLGQVLTFSLPAKPAAVGLGIIKNTSVWHAWQFVRPANSILENFNTRILAC